MPNDKLDEVLKVVGLLAHRSSGGDYIFRGEPECYERVSSSLYRHYQNIEAGSFDIEIASSCSRVISIPACISPTVTADTKSCWLIKYETRSKNCYCAWCGGWAAPPPPNHRKDQGLFSEITLECLTRPGIDRHTKKELVSHSQHEKKHPHLIGNYIELYPQRERGP